MGVEDKNMEQRMNALSESKVRLLEKLLKEQKKKKGRLFKIERVQFRFQKGKKNSSHYLAPICKRNPGMLNK